jgi:hypothetical protein
VGGAASDGAARVTPARRATTKTIKLKEAFGELRFIGSFGASRGISVRNVGYASRRTRLSAP